MKEKKQEKKQNPTSHDKWWNWVIGIELALYLVLTAAIFMIQNKIALLSEAKAQTSTPQVLPQVPTQPPNLLPQNTLIKNKPDRSQQPTKVENQADLQTCLTTAQLYYERGELDKAIKLYKEAIRLDPKNVEVHLLLGQLCMAKPAYYFKASEHLQKVLELEPNHPKRKSIEVWLQTAQNNTK
jgi:tetratricopeptide (TPR) repeat protein